MRGISNWFLRITIYFCPRITGGVRQKRSKGNDFLKKLKVRDERARLGSDCRMARLNPNQIKAALPTVPLWKKRGAVIARTCQFPDFPAAIKFVNALARLAEKAGHHPDIDIRWNKVTLALTDRKSVV